VKLGEAERKLHKAEKTAQLQEDINAIIKLQNQGFKDLAEKVSVDEKVIQNLVNGGTHYVWHHQPVAFNALVHKAAGEMNDSKLLFVSLESVVLILAYCRPRTQPTFQAQRNPGYHKTWDGQWLVFPGLYWRSHRRVKTNANGQDSGFEIKQHSCLC
jgi:hypothetical protein